MAWLSFLVCTSLLMLQTSISGAKNILPMNAVKSSRYLGDRALHPVGDMLLDSAQWGHILQRHALVANNLWPLNSDGIPEVPYMIEDDAVNVKQFELAMSRWEEDTCLKFKELPPGDESVTSYISVTTLEGCMSEVGYKPDHVTVISLDSTCGRWESLHVLGHALNFVHEDTRSDRDDAVIIVSENIEQGQESKFAKSDSSNDGKPYDYMSIMHGRSRDFSRDFLRVILTKDPRFQNLIGNFEDLSFYDSKHFNILYGCDMYGACQYPSGHTICSPAKDCSSVTGVCGAVSADDKKTILEEHNNYRNKVANGEEDRGMPGPQSKGYNIFELTWDQDLADSAQRWAEQRQKGHDCGYTFVEVTNTYVTLCRNTQDYDQVGQNVMYSGSTLQISQRNWADAIKAWTDEVVDVRGSDFTNPTHRAIGHYTQVMWHSSKTVGCGVFANDQKCDYMGGNWWQYYCITYVCNYGPAGNMQGEPPYSTDSSDSCKTYSSDYPQLCTS